MKILVLIKETPDTETKINIADDGMSIDHSNTKFIINPYDEYAIEEALRIKEATQDTEVVVATFGSPTSKEHLVKAMAMGADRAVLINNQSHEMYDSLATAKVLSKLIQREEANLVLCGKQAIDDDNMHVGSMVAELLGWPHVNVANKVSVEEAGTIVEREVEGGRVEVYNMKLPCVIGANKALNSPRYTSLPGIMKAKKKPFEMITPGDLGIDSLTNKVQLKGIHYPPEKPPGKVFNDGNIANMVDQVVNLLRNEAKVL